MQQSTFMRVLTAVGLVAALAAPALAQIPASGPAREAADAYQAYIKTVMKATSVKDVLPHLSREALESGLGMPESEEEAKELLELIQLMMPKDIKITGAKVEGEKVVLTATGVDEGAVANGTITMAREDGRWKVAREQWNVKSES
jgi:hypothetical protein